SQESRDAEKKEDSYHRRRLRGRLYCHHAREVTEERSRCRSRPDQQRKLSGFPAYAAGGISGSIGILDTIAPIRRLCPKTNLYTREVEAIDLKRKTVTTTAGFRPR